MNDFRQFGCAEHVRHALMVYAIVARPISPVHLTTRASAGADVRRCGIGWFWRQHVEPEVIFIY
jgi:hypothetical protein